MGPTFFDTKWGKHKTGSVCTSHTTQFSVSSGSSAVRPSLSSQPSLTSMRVATAVFLSCQFFVINAARGRTYLVKHTASAWNTTDERYSGWSITWGVSHVITQCWLQHRRLSDRQRNAPRKTVEIYTFLSILTAYITVFYVINHLFIILENEKFLKMNFSVWHV